MTLCQRILTVSWFESADNEEVISKKKTYKESSTYNQKETLVISGTYDENRDVKKIIFIRHTEGKTTTKNMFKWIDDRRGIKKGFRWSADI